MIRRGWILGALLALLPAVRGKHEQPGPDTRRRCRFRVAARPRRRRHIHADPGHRRRHDRSCAQELDSRFRAQLGSRYADEHHDQRRRDRRQGTRQPSQADNTDRRLVPGIPEQRRARNPRSAGRHRPFQPGRAPVVPDHVREFSADPLRECTDGQGPGTRNRGQKGSHPFWQNAKGDAPL